MSSLQNEGIYWYHTLSHNIETPIRQSPKGLFVNISG